MEIGDRVRRINTKLCGVVIHITNHIVVYVRWDNGDGLEYVHANDLKVQPRSLT